MGALWGGCDDASGPVLVLVMTNGFRKSQSPPLGGAIPSAVSPEEADTLEHRERVEGTSLNDWPSFFFFSCHATQISQCFPASTVLQLVIMIPWETLWHTEALAVPLNPSSHSSNVAATTLFWSVHHTRPGVIQKWNSLPSRFDEFAQIRPFLCFYHLQVGYVV